MAAGMATAPVGPPSLLLVLEVAVPMWIDRIRDWSVDERTRRAGELVDAIASHGDDLFGRPKGKRGQSAEAFNRTAEALAIGSYQPGGVSFGGLHWQVAG